MSAFNRVKQWTTFARVWYLFDATWQDPNVAGRTLVKYLLGTHKPIYSKAADCGDYVVVINSKKISLKNDDWRTKNLFYHTGYSKGAKYTPAWQFHLNDPKKLIIQATKCEMPRFIERSEAISRLIVYPDDKVPLDIIQNVSDQIRAVNQIPKPLQDYKQEEIDKFPKLFEWPQDFVISELRESSQPVNVIVGAKAAVAKKK